MKSVPGIIGRGSVSRTPSPLTAILILMDIEGELLNVYLISATLILMGIEGELLNVHLDRQRVKHRD